jgi:nitroreductase
MLKNMNLLHKLAAQKRKNKLKILDDIIFRWSPKAMTGKPISKDELTPLFEAARWAPSSSNNQEWHYYFALRGSKAFDTHFKLLNPGNQEWCDKAGALIILVSQKISDYKDYPIRTHAFDAGASFEAFSIEGLRRNLVVHPMGGFNRDEATKYLKLDTDRYEVQIMIAVGEPNISAESREVTDRKSVEEISAELK